MSESREHELQHELETEFKREERTEHELEKVHELEHQLEQEREEEHKEEERIEHKIEAERHHHDFELVFILNGEDVRVRIDPSCPLVKAVEKALIESGNSGRKNPSEWEVRNSSGALLDMQRSAAELGLESGARLFLSLRVGAGGCK